MCLYGTTTISFGTASGSSGTMVALRTTLLNEYRNYGEKGFVQNLVKEEKKEPNSQTSYQIYLIFSHIFFLLRFGSLKKSLRTSGQTMVTDKDYSSTLLSVWKQGVDIICTQKEELLLSCIRTPYWRIEHTERFPGLESWKLVTTSTLTERLQPDQLMWRDRHGCAATAHKPTYIFLTRNSLFASDCLC